MPAQVRDLCVRLVDGLGASIDSAIGRREYSHSWRPSGLVSDRLNIRYIVSCQHGLDRGARDAQPGRRGFPRVAAAIRSSGIFGVRSAYSRPLASW